MNLIADERLFLETVDDLRKRSVLMATPYDIRQASGLIRRLMIDKTNLLDPIQRKYRIKASFEWFEHFTLHEGRIFLDGYYSDPAMINFDIAALPIDLLISPDPPTIRLGTASQFLSRPVMLRAEPERPGIPLKDHKQLVRTRELVKYFANRQGGVHWDIREPDNPLFVDALDTPWLQDLILHSVSAVGRIIVRGLDPIASAIFRREYAKAWMD